jgi:hypothetical protein
MQADNKETIKQYLITPEISNAGCYLRDHKTKRN